MMMRTYSMMKPSIISEAPAESIQNSPRLMNYADPLSIPRYLSLSK